MAWNFASGLPLAEGWLADAFESIKDVFVHPQNMGPTTKLVLAVGVVALSLIGGNYIARALRMKEYASRIALVLFTFVASLVINYVGWPPKRGIDLSGGVVLVYEIDKELSQGSWMPKVVERLTDALKAEGGERLEARATGDNEIEIIAPEGTDAGRIEKAVNELRGSEVMLREKSHKTADGKTTYVYSAEQSQKSVNMDDLITAVGRRINPSGVKELTIRRYGAEQIEVIVPEVEQSEVELIKEKISTSGLLEFRIVANENDHRELIKIAERTPGRDVYMGGRLAGRWVEVAPDVKLTGGNKTRQTTGQPKEALVVIDIYDVDGRYLTNAKPDVDARRGGWAVHFNFDATGANKFGQLTRKNLPDPGTDFHRQLGIVLDNRLLSDPVINDVIRDSGEITGNFTQQQVETLVGILNAGRLPASLRKEPISQQRISSQLGDDTIRMGTDSMIFSTAAILVFMLVYYRFCGIIADIAVTLNVVVTVALMILIKAAFTLPGLAGLVLTVGMAVDANVLIYERMREESARGASLRMAIRNGFSRAWATIVDSHVTTLSTGVVLYIIGTDQIKGFAVTLVLGLLMSMYTAVFVSRVIVDVAERKRILTKLNMMHLIGHTEIDFIRWRAPAIGVSIALVLIGAIAAVFRGPEILDIDFTGGSSVQLVFAEGQQQDIAVVREKVSFLPDVAVSSVGEGGLEFKVDTSNGEIKEVQESLHETFKGQLRTYSMANDTPQVIEAEKPDKKPDESQAEPAAKETYVPALGPRQRWSTWSPREALFGVVTTLADDDAENKAEAAENKAEAAAQAEAKELTKAAEPPAVETPPKQDSPKPALEQAKSAEVEPTGSMIGGTRVQLTFPQEISHGPLREIVTKALAEQHLEGTDFRLSNPGYHIGSELRFKEWTLEVKLSPDQTVSLLDVIKSRLAAMPVFPSSKQIGGKVAGDTQLIALYALLASMAIIVLYVWFRFQNVIFGVGAVVALVHDVFVTVGFLALSSYLSPYLGFLLVDPFKISLPVVAALLTIVGFSINDTIVVFDRIREVRGKSPDLTPRMINDSVNQTLSRTLLTSGTVFIASVILYVVGGPGIHAFAFCMVIGVIAGTYSSIYIAAPILLWLKKPSTSAAQSGGAMATAGSK